MSIYKPDIKIYYGKLDADHRLVPAPDITISLEYNYSNDTIIGYTYIINLNGSATALDLRDVDDAEIPPSPNYNSGSIMDHIHKLRKILSQNGNILHIVDRDGTSILKAKGGILRSLSFNESPNNWTHYATYSATIEFNSVDFTDKTEDCDSLFLDPNTYNTNGITDLTKFKIKSFNDSWSITFDENEAFSKIKNNDVNKNLNINNHSFNIQYTISSVGKHFFNYTNETTGESKLLPAWEQAKNFVQSRLYDQVTSLINNVLKNSYSSCSSADGLDDILEPGTSADGLLKDIGNSKYKIFNEKITCEASESEGSFSATYNAIVKSNNGNASWSSPETKHIVSKSISTDYSSGSPIKNISVKGTIEGLVEGGIIRSSNPIILPKTGSILIYNDNSNINNKYTNAKLLLDKIYSELDYNNGIGENGKRDLKPIFKNILGITATALGINNSSIDTTPDPPHPISFNLTHDYNNGTINYSIEYSGKRTCGKKFSEISIQITQPTKLSAMFNIPNSNSCPVFQELGTYTAKKVSITAQGIDLSENGQPTNVNIVNEIINDLNLGCYGNGYMPISLGSDGIITEKRYTRNPLDGTFTVNIGYICSNSCPI